MNYCQFRNLTIKRMANAGGATPILPAEYQAVEYLQSSGTQYINIGAISNHQYYDIDFTWLNFVNNTGGNYGVNGLLGINSYNQQGIPDVKVWLLKNNSISSIIGTTTIGACSINTGVKYNMYFSPTSFKVDDVDYTTGSGQFNANVDCYIFTVHNSDSNSNAWGSAVKIFRLETSSIELYPCYRKSDVKPGFYDVTNDSFYPNAGTGEFYMGIPQNKVQLVNYIRSTGTQYIDTHINNWNNTLEYEITLSVEAQNSGSRSYFGAYDAWTTSGTVTPGIGSYISYRVPTSFAAGYSASSGTDIGITNGQTGTYSLRGNTLSWSSGTSTSFNRGSNFTNSKSITICAVNGAGTIGEFVKTSIYGAKFWMNGNLIRDFKPALLQGIKPGLYDTVEHCFYPNAGTGEFLYG